MSLKTSENKRTPLIDFSAPAGGGGTGYFRAPLNLNPATAGLHLKGPGEHNWLAQTSTHENKPNSRGNKPPETKTGTTNVLIKRTGTQNINIKVKVLPDRQNSSIDKDSAETFIEFAETTYLFPGYKTIMVDGQEKISKLKGKFSFSGTITIQTTYGNSTSATDTSKYGRGTTEEDKENGDITVGFHESHHRQALLWYLQNKPLPEMELKAKISSDQYDKQQYEEDMKLFETNLNDYKKNIRIYSNKTADEVGYTLSQCIRDGNC